MAQIVQMTLEYPVELPLLLKTSRTEFEAEVRFLAAAKLYELGKISSGKAAQMAGLPRVEFLSRLGQYGMAAVNLSGDEVKAEVETAQKRKDAT
jgi:predicted HTH domain antitoxin